MLLGAESTAFDGISLSLSFCACMETQTLWPFPVFLRAAFSIRLMATWANRKQAKVLLPSCPTSGLPQSLQWLTVCIDSHRRLECGRSAGSPRSYQAASTMEAMLPVQYAAHLWMNGCRFWKQSVRRVLFTFRGAANAEQPLFTGPYCDVHRIKVAHQKSS